MRRSLGLWLSLTLLLASPNAWAEGIELTSREYKMMLKPDPFAGSAPEQAIARFLEQLAPAVREHWGDSPAAELTQKGFELDERRMVQFWDTHECLLQEHGFAWRARADEDDQGGKVELTLKFRSPDAFLAAALSLEALDETADKLEEDLGPLAVRTDNGDETVAMPRNVRSQFSRSTTVTVKAGKEPESLAGIADLFPSFENDLEAFVERVDLAATLEVSPGYRELVYESSRIDLTDRLKSRFSLTFWYPKTQPDRPTLAEVSFKYDTDHGKVSLKAARRSLELLRALQDLPWADPAAPTKTALIACDRS